MLKIGCHLSATKGFLNMGKEALSIGANTFQYFSRNPRGGKAKELDIKDINAYQQFAKENKIGTILAHAPYTLNPCSADEKVRDFAYIAMEDDLRRLEYLPNSLYNFHPGSHVGQGIEKGIELIVEMLNHILKEEQTTIVLLETMAGKGSEIGSTFMELKSIIDGVKLTDKIGVCMDTCHVFDAGYDIVNHLDDVLEQFDQIIGLHRIKAVHLNDSIFGYESHKDRHAKIGEGKLGLEAITRIINHPKLCDLPFFLETPNELDGYQAEIALLKSKYKC